MKQSNILRARELFPGSDIVRKYTFKAIQSGDKSALLAKENHILAMELAVLRVESALLQGRDCFECLSPRGMAV